jgi:hypothetical protein
MVTSKQSPEVARTERNQLVERTLPFVTLIDTLGAIIFSSHLITSAASFVQQRM